MIEFHQLMPYIDNNKGPTRRFSFQELIRHSEEDIYGPPTWDSPSEDGYLWTEGRKKRTDKRRND